MKPTMSLTTRPPMRPRAVRRLAPVPDLEIYKRPHPAIVFVRQLPSIPASRQQRRASLRAARRAGVSGVMVGWNLFHAIDDATHAVEHVAEAAVHAVSHSAEALIHTFDDIGHDVSKMAHGLSEAAKHGLGALAKELVDDATHVLMMPYDIIKKPLQEGLKAAGLGAVSSILDAPDQLNKSINDMNAHMAAAILRGDPKGLLAAVKEGNKEITSNPLFQAAETAVSFVPGIGEGISAGMAAAAALGRGESLVDVALDAAKSALPGGPLVQAALDIGVGLAKGQSITKAALGAVRDELPGGDIGKAAFDAAVGLASGKPVSDVLLSTIRDHMPGGELGAAAFDAANALARGKNPSDAILAAARDALPGGDDAKMAFDAAVNLAKGKPPTGALLGAIKANLPPDIHGVLDAGIQVSRQLPLSEAGLLAMRDRLPGGDAAKAAFDAGVALHRRAHLPVDIIQMNRQALPAASRKVFDSAWKAAYAKRPGPKRPTQAEPERYLPGHYPAGAQPFPPYYLPGQRPAGVGETPGGILKTDFVTPDSVRAEIEKEHQFLKSLAKDIVRAVESSKKPIDPKLTAFVDQWLTWHAGWKKYYDKYSTPSGWSMLESLVVSPVADLLDKYESEGRDQQAKFKALGYESQAQPGAQPDTGGGFGSGLGLGALAALGAVVLLSR